MRSPNTHKCHSCICSAKTPACSYISPAVTSITGFALVGSCLGIKVLSIMVLQDGFRFLAVMGRG